MGDAAIFEGDHVLLLLPFEQDDSMRLLINNIKKRHPGATFEYHTIIFTPAWQGDISGIPKGGIHQI
jgi:hypothetical protein